MTRKRLVPKFRQVVRATFWYLLTLLICAHFSLTYVADRPLFISLHEYAAGRAKIPYQYRILVGWLLHAMASIPDFANAAGRLPFFRHDPYLLGLLLIVCPALFGAVVATRASITLLTGDAVYGRWASLLLVYLSYFTLSLSYGLNYVLPYDVPSLLFFCLGIYLLLRRRYWIYYPVFFLAVLNRETSAFLALFFCVCEWFYWEKESTVERLTRRIGPHVLLQAGIWVAIKIELVRLYGHNLSDTSSTNPLVADHLFYNLRELLKPQQWPLLASVFGFLLPALILGRRYIRERRIAWACALMLPLWFIAMMVVAVVVEIRVFNELNSILAIALALIGYHLWQQRSCAA